MDPIFPTETSLILIRLLIAHFITDFFLQSNEGIRNKVQYGIRSAYLWKHIVMITVLSWMAIGSLNSLPQAIFIGFTHLLIDWGKITLAARTNIRYKNGYQLRLFLADQILHIIMIVMVWLWLINGWEAFGILSIRLWLNYQLFLGILAYVFVIRPVSYMVKFLTEKWISDLEHAEVGLKDAGMWIGYLERTLILTFVFLDQYAAIGLLVTAKSVLRLIDKPEAPRIDVGNKLLFNARKHTEYVLIGTFISFTFALSTGLLVKWLL
ncbi:MAG TPA: DUF3307 domain-containing protein [Flavisolibacter sp.]|nr:DUF3307 domain-containing protein [Flavisolibacter sp.]